MNLDSFLTAVVYLASSYLLFFIGKWIYDWLQKKIDVDKELFEKDNSAFAITLVGYYLGLMFAIGGAVVGPSKGIVHDLMDIFLYGIVSIILMNVSSWVADKLILYKFDDIKEIIDDRNAGTGVVQFAVYVASGLIIFGAVSGEGGSIFTALVFWLLGQIALVIAGFVYNFFAPYDIHEHIEKDNVAVGIGFSGAIIAMGNILRFSLGGDFVSWGSNIGDFALYFIIGIMLLPAVRYLTDKILVPGVTLSHELVEQENPNVGAAFIEAFSYISASFFITWCL